MLALAEKEMLIRALGQVVFDEVQTAVAPILDRIEKLENGTLQALVGQAHTASLEYIDRQIAALPKAEKGENGDDGKDGRDGKDVDQAACLEMCREWAVGTVYKLYEDGAIKSGVDGKDGKDGVDGKDGKDGKDGRDGTDGKSVSMDEIRDCLADLVLKAFADAPVPRNCVGGYIDRSGHLFLSYSDGSNSDLGEVAGKNGKDCDLELVRSQVAAFLATIEKPKDGKDGRDGVGFDDLDLDFDGERLVTLKFVKGETAKVFNLTFPTPIYRGVWKEGAYERGDEVQRDGSMWIAERDTKAMPGLPDSGWKLCTKRGRDGKEGKQGLQGIAGKDGRDGRDLTQIGPDGRKW